MTVTTAKDVLMSINSGFTATFCGTFITSVVIDRLAVTNSSPQRLRLRLF